MLKSPSVEEAASLLTGTGKDRWGNLNHSFGGAFLIPFSSRITGELSADGEMVTTNWHGASIRLPANSGKYAVHGLLNELKAQDLQTIKTADGPTETAVIHPAISTAIGCRRRICASGLRSWEMRSISR